MTTVGIKTPGSLAAASCRWCRDTDVLAIAGHFDLQAFPHEVRVVHHTQDIDLIDVPPKRSRMVKVSSWDGHFFIIGFTWEIHQNQLLQLSDVYIMLSSPSHVLYKPVSSTQLNQSLAKALCAGSWHHCTVNHQIRLSRGQGLSLSGVHASCDAKSLGILGAGRLKL